MFANRLRKNLQRLRAWAAREHISCFRLYDADMPEYAFAIDQYVEANEQAHVHLQVQEYAAPAEIELEAVRRRRNEVLASLPSVTGVPSERIHVRLRQRQSGEAQYTRQRADSADPSPMLPVQEAGLTFLVNLDDYLDTGLFLDHRSFRTPL